MNALFTWKTVPNRATDSTIMQRMHLLRTPWFEVAIHRFFDPDDLANGLHDHPWDFFSIVILGAYFEAYYAHDGVRMRRRGLFSFAFHRASYCHAIVDVERPCYTLVVTSRRKRKWGFPSAGIKVR